MKIEVEIPNEWFEVQVQETIKGMLGQTKYIDDAGAKVKAMLMDATKKVVNNALPAFYAMIASEVEKQLPVIVEEEVRNALRSRVKKELSKQLPLNQ